MSLNQFIRNILRQYMQNQEKSTAQKLIDLSEKVSVKTKSFKWNRDEICDRKVFS